MNKKGQLSIGMIVMIFIGIIVGIALINEIATQQGISTTKSNIINESIDITSAWVTPGLNSSITFTVSENPTGWKITGCALESVVWANATQVFALTTDYTINASTGVFTIVPTAVMNGSGNSTLASYLHCRDGYNTSGGARGIANLWVLFAAFALMAFVTIGIKNEWFS